jgi:hypothetical protein
MQPGCERLRIRPNSQEELDYSAPVCVRHKKETHCIMMLRRQMINYRLRSTYEPGWPEVQRGKHSELHNTIKIFGNTYGPPPDTTIFIIYKNTVGEIMKEISQKIL